MELIFARDNLQIYADSAEMSACIMRGNNKIVIDLEPLVPLSPLEAKNLRLLGQNPADFLHIGHSCHIIPKAASDAWEEVLARAELAKKNLDTAMIPLFRQNLPGLAEVREVEDLLDSISSNMGIYFDASDSIAGLKAAEIRRRYPRESLYVQAERIAMGSDERRVAAARKILAALICGKELPAPELHLLEEHSVPNQNRPPRLQQSTL